MEAKRKFDEEGDNEVVGEEYLIRLKALKQRELECDERQIMLDNREGNLDARFNMVEEFAGEVEAKFEEVQQAIDEFNDNLVDFRDREEELEINIQALVNEKFFHAGRVKFEKTILLENINTLKRLFDGYYKPKSVQSLRNLSFQKMLECFRTGQLFEESFYFANYEMMLPKFIMYFKNKCHLEDGSGGWFVCANERKYCESCSGIGEDDDDCFFCHHTVHSHEMILMNDLFDLKKFKKSWENCIGITIN